MLFWFAILVILALTMYFVWRAWAVQLGVEITPEQSDVAIYNARIEEIGRDLEAKRLDPEMAEAAKAEEARKLLKSQSDLEESEKGSNPSGWWMTLGLFSIPLVSVLVYLSLGTPPHMIANNEPPEVARQSMDQLIAAAEKRLETKPDDLQGWQVLLPVYMRQQAYDKAETAIKNIIRIGGEKTEYYSMLGEIQVAKEQGLVTPEALGAFEKAFDLNSRNSDARFFMGLHARQNGNTEKARSIWQGMIDDADGNEDWIPVMKQRIAELDGRVPQNTQNRSVEDIASLPKDEQQAQILSMVAGLAARLEEDPNNKSGWIRLVRAYRVLGENEDAEEAAFSAKQAFPEDLEFITQLDEAMKTPKGAVN